jgi:hypothetical protein
LRAVVPAGGVGGPAAKKAIITIPISRTAIATMMMFLRVCDGLMGSGLIGGGEGIGAVTEVPQYAQNLAAPGISLPHLEQKRILLVSPRPGGVVARSSRRQLAQNTASAETCFPHLSQNGVFVPSMKDVRNPA